MKATKFANVVTKGGTREQSKQIGTLLVNKYGGSISFSRRKEDGSYEDAVGLTFPSGETVELGKFNNIHPSTTDTGVLNHFVECLKKGQEYFAQRLADRADEL